MPVFICTRGDVNNISLEDEGCFVVTDAQRQRNWFCSVQTDMEAIPSSAT